MTLVTAVVNKEIPEATALAVIRMAFPDIPEPLVQKLLASARGFTPAPPVTA